MPGPLHGFTILDLSAMLSGPWCTSILGDQGADVIKIEVPGKGDHTRALRNQRGGLPVSAQKLSCRGPRFCNCHSNILFFT